MGTFCDSGDEKVEALFSRFDLAGRLRDLLQQGVRKRRSSAALRESAAYVACAAADRSRADALATGPVPGLLSAALALASEAGDVAAQRAVLRGLLTIALAGADGAAALRKARCADAALPLASSPDAYVAEAAAGLLVRLGEFRGAGAKEAREAAAASSPNPATHSADAFVCCEWAEAADAARAVLNALVVRGRTVCTDLFSYEERDWTAVIRGCRTFVLILSGAHGPAPHMCPHTPPCHPLPHAREKQRRSSDPRARFSSAQTRRCAPSAASTSSRPRRAAAWRLSAW